MTKAIKSNAAEAKQFFADKMASTTRPAEMSHQMEKGEDIAIFDIREPNELKKGHVPGAFSLARKNGAPWPLGAGML
jgi:rhodanese-related sulfurtransferase